METYNKLTNDIKTALKNKDTVRLGVIRLIITAVNNIKLASKKQINLEETTINALKTFEKQRIETIELYKEKNKPDKVEEEEKELAIVREYLPKLMTKEEIVKIVNNLIKEYGTNFGNIMKIFMHEYKACVDGNTVKAIIQKELKNV